MEKKLLVKCRRCQHLETHKDPEGLLIRCGAGFYDYFGKPVYYAVSALTCGRSSVYQAIRKCGSSFQAMRRK